jgi:hypothetical protein
LVGVLLPTTFAGMMDAAVGDIIRESGAEKEAIVLKTHAAQIGPCKKPARC